MRIVAVLLNALCALLGVAVVTIVAAASFIDPNDYRARVIAAVQDATGRTLTLGKLTLTRSLWPTLQAEDVSLSNLPGGSRPQMAHAERIEGELALLALLRHEIDLTHLVLTGPNILFETVGGQPNWIFAPAATEPAAGDPSGDRTPYSLRVEAAQVRNGMVTWRLPARTKVVGIRALDYTRKRRGGPVEAHGTLVYADNQPFDLQVRADPTGELMDPWQTRLHLAAFDTDATATGTLQVSGPFDLQLDGTSGALEKLNALLPELGLPPLHGVSFSARLTNGKQPGDIPTVGPASIRFASANLRNMVPGLVLGATSASLPAPGGSAAIDSSGTFDGTSFHLTGNLGVPVHPDGKSSLPVSLALDAAAAKATLKGTLAADTLAFAGLSGTATLQAASLASLRPVLGAALPALGDVHLSANVSVPASANPVTLKSVSLRTAEGDLSGDGTVGLGPTPSLGGTWHADHLDLTAVLQALVGRTAATPAGSTLIPATPLPWPSLRGLALDLSATIGAMDFAGQIWRDVQLALTLKNGQLRAAPVSVAMPGSRMAATFAVDAASPGTPSHLTLNAPALPLGLLGRLFGVVGSDSIGGTAAVQADLQATGNTVRAAATSLNGRFSMMSTGGGFSNAALIGVAEAALKALSINVPADGHSKLDCLGLAGSFDAGVATLRTIAFGSTYLTAEGTGTVDLRNETVALQLQPMAMVAGSPVSVPVKVAGPFRNVTGALDAGGLQQVGILLDGLFGGDRADVCRAAGLVR